MKKTFESIDIPKEDIIYQANGIVKTVYFVVKSEIKPCKENHILLPYEKYIKRAEKITDDFEANISFYILILWNGESYTYPLYKDFLEPPLVVSPNGDCHFLIKI